jgi:DNA-binding IclR family transcriptional regulator
VKGDSSTSTVSRIFAVLSAIAERSGEGRDLTVSDIARAVGRERSQVSRMLKSLSACGLVEQDPATRAYRLGWQLYALAASSGDQRLLALGRPVLADLSAQTGEVALLSVLRGSRVLTVLRQDSPRLLQAGGWVGLTSPLHVTAAGRALLFDYSDAQIGRLVQDDIGRDAFGPRAPGTLSELSARGLQERKQGCAVAVDELEAGFASVAAPVRDTAGIVVAAVGASGPSSRIVDRLDELALQIRAAAERLTDSLRIDGGREGRAIRHALPEDRSRTTAKPSDEERT